MSDNNADYNGSGQDEYFATNDSTQADYRQSQDGYNQPASQPHNPNPYASQQPVQGYAPGTQGNNIPGGTYGNGQPYGQSAAYGSSVPAYGSAAPAYGQPTQPAQPAQPIYGQPTYGPTDYAQSAQTPYYQEPTQPQYTQSAYNQPPTYAQQTYYQADPTAARLWLRAEVEDRRRPARPVPRHPRRAQLLSGIYRQGRGPAVADPDRMDHPHRTDHFRNLGSDRSRPHPVLQLRVQLAPRWARPRTPRLMGRGLYKQPGGKLVGVSVRLSDDIPAYFRECASSIQSVEQCRIDGDFFLDGDDKDSRRLLQDWENLLQSQRGAPTRDITRRLQAITANYPNVRLVGMTAEGIAIAFLRAIAGSESRNAEDATGNGNIARSTKQYSGEQPGMHNALTQEEYLERWRDLKPTVIHDKPRDPNEQMETDIAWAREVAAGKREPTLRIWEWAAPAVVIGKFQSLEDEVNTAVAQKEGFTVVRRCTGGGAMFIEPGNTITYSLYAPFDFTQGISIEESYRLCDFWLVRALKELGLDVRFSGLNDIATQYGKLGGAAQRRFTPVEGGPGAILHHVTLAYDIDAEKMGRVLNTSREKMSDKAVKSAVKRVDPMRSQTGMSREDVVERLLDAARRVTM